MAAMFASLICVSTMIIKVPSPLGGYVNLGDGLVLLSAFMMTPLYAFFASAIGSALADLLAGYAMYVPATFIIKGLMALAAHFIASAIKKGGSGRTFAAHTVGGAAAETIMIVGYFLFEGFIYGFAAVLANIPANAVQGLFGIVIGTVLARVFEKVKILP